MESITTPALPGPARGTPVRRASLTAGLGLLLMAGFAGIGYGAAVSGLVTPGDAARTAADVAASPGLFRLGIVCLVAVVALDVVVAWALYLVLRPAHPALAALAAALRLVYAAVFLVAVGHLASALAVLTAEDRSELLDGEQSRALALLEIGAFEDTWNIGLALFGLHLLVIGGLLLRTAAPRLLAWLVVLSGTGYVFDTVAGVLTGGTWPTIALYTFVGEVLLALWLLIRGGRDAVSPAGSGAAGGR